MLAGPDELRQAAYTVRNHGSRGGHRFEYGSRASLDLKRWQRKQASVQEKFLRIGLVSDERDMFAERECVVLALQLPATLVPANENGEDRWDGSSHTIDNAKKL